MSARARAQERLAALRAKRDAIRAKRAARPKRKEEKRRPWWLLLVLLALLLWFLHDCGEADAPVMEAPPAPAAPIASGPPPPPAPAPVPEMATVPRPAFRPAPPSTVPWVRALRMQVAARSPRLAECFEGADRPGQLRWSATVEPGSGAVSDHRLEPMLHTSALARDERDCVVAVLTDPPYRLDAEGSEPSRVGIVLEF